MRRDQKQQIISDKAPKPMSPYSQGIRSGNMIFVSGQGPIDPQSGAIMGSNIEEQTQYTLDNVKMILEAVGANMDHVVKVSAHLSDLDDFSGYNKVYNKFFHAPYPARTTVGSKLLGIMVEIDVIAVLPEEG